MAEQETKENKLIAVIRISGQVKVPKEISNTLDRLKIKRKYHTTIVDPNNISVQGMLKKIRYYVAYGNLNEETLIKLLKARAISLDKKPINEREIASKIMSSKSLKDLNIIPFFRLHPPRRGIKSKLQYPKGVLSNNFDAINKLILRML